MLDQIKQYALGVLVAVLIGIGWFGRTLYDDSVVRAIAETRTIADNAAAERIAGISITNTTIQGKVIEHVRTEVQYSECKHSPDTMNLINEAFK